MAAAGHLLEAPPLVAPVAPLPARGLAALPGGVEPRLAEAERLAAENRHEEALRALEGLWPDAHEEPGPALRHRLAEAWSLMYVGRLDEAGELLAHAAAIVRSPRFDAAQRAEVLFRRGCVTLLGGDVAGAESLFTRALGTNDRSPLPSRSLAARTHEWRSRCHQRRRDLEAAGRDAERALELAAEIGDEHLQARALVQASLVAERQRQWLAARYSAEEALELFTRRGDLLASARVRNNLGGILFLLGDADGARRELERAAETAAAAGSDADAAQATSSLAQVHLRSGRPEEARRLACRAAEALAGRRDFRYELGNAELVAARAFAAVGDGTSARAWFERAEATFGGLDLAAELAAVHVARGDFERGTGDVDTAADLYRRAAESLQDVHF